MSVENPLSAGSSTVGAPGAAAPATLPKGQTLYVTNASGAVTGVYVGDDTGTPVQVLAPQDLPGSDPSLNALVASNADPQLAVQSWQTTNSWLLGVLVRVTKDTPISRVWTWVKTAGVTFTNANRMGVFLPNGALIGLGADQGNATAGLGWGTTGAVSAPLTVQAGQTLNRTRGELLVVCFLQSATTFPAFGRIGSGAGEANIGLDGSAGKPFRYSSSGPTFTAMPATLNGVAMAATAATPWVGLS